MISHLFIETVFYEEDSKLAFTHSYSPWVSPHSDTPYTPSL